VTRRGIDELMELMGGVPRRRISEFPEFTIPTREVPGRGIDELMELMKKMGLSGGS
jgi:hypothetical protein